MAVATPAEVRRPFVRSPDRPPGIDILSAWQNESHPRSRPLLGARGGSLIGAMDGGMDGWMNGRSGRKPIPGKRRRAGGSTSSLSAFLGDVPLIAATTVPLGQSVIPSVSRKRDGTAVGEKGYLPLNTLNKMNRKRESTERGERRKGKRSRETASSDVQCGIARATSRPPFAESFVNPIRGWECTMPQLSLEAGEKRTEWRGSSCFS